MAKKLIKSEKLQRQAGQLERRYEGRSEESTEETNQDAGQSDARTERKPPECKN
jgi:hypothetical protein